jgi:GDP/UDP-N,N'-diacetylbacillosamine 2-epimerase (hydrolysing)
MSKRRILGITAIRSEYFLQRPVFEAIKKHDDLELEVIVTGAHLSPLHGYTVRDVENDGYSIAARIDSLINSDRDAARIKGAATQLQVVAHLVDAMRPDWLLVPADREESIVLALSGAYMGLPIAHYGAGDRVVGNVDDMIRHSVSRLAHLLLTGHEEARQRLIRAGEEEWRVHNVGLSGIDRIRQTPTLDRETLASSLGIDEIRDPYLVVVQHPLSSESELAGQQMRETLEAVVQLEMQTFISYPNSDPGSGEIIKQIEKYQSNPNIHAFKNIPDIPFVNLLRGAAALIGNSSLGLMEAPYLHLPVLNVGRRQAARHHSENVFFADHDRQAIVSWVHRVLSDDALKQQVNNCSNPFGEGYAGERIADLLASTPINAKLLNKDLSY